MSKVISVRGLVRRFGELVAVNGIDLDVNSGEIFGVLGPNGAGKSTMIRMLCGLLTPSEGTGTVLGHDLLREGNAIKSGIGYMTQTFSLYLDISVEENMRFFAGIHGLPFMRRSKRIEEQMAHYGLDERRKQIVGTLSGGWRQRVALACATIHKPQLLFLDEPTAGVDPVSRREFWQQIGALARAGTTVLVSTHYMDEAEHFDRLAFIFRGRQLDVGTPQELITRSDLAVYEVPSRDAAAAAELAQQLSNTDHVIEAAVHSHAVRVVVRGKSKPSALADATPTRTTIEDTFVALAKEPAA